MAKTVAPKGKRVDPRDVVKHVAQMVKDGTPFTVIEQPKKVAVSKTAVKNLGKPKR